MRRLVWCLAVLAVPMIIGACSSPPAPVVDRSSSPSRMVLEKDGQYRVRRGDTLHAIAFHYGLDHRDIARWNGIRAPYIIYPDQFLRLSAVSKTASSSRKQSVRKKPGKPTSIQPTKPPAKPPVTQSSGTDQPAMKAGDPPAWVWPVEGRILRGFLANDPARNGLDISGREGQSVKATAAGSVVYSGNGLIGYGELIIIKHSERMLSAYAHNRIRLVKEGDKVRLGQKIAEVGRNDRNEAILHFEIRVNGKPADPRKYLPVR